MYGASSDPTQNARFHTVVAEYLTSTTQSSVSLMMRLPSLVGESTLWAVRFQMLTRLTQSKRFDDIFELEPPNQLAASPKRPSF